MTDQNNAVETRMEIPTQVVEQLRSALGERLVSVVLFGSQARGEATAESDWDLLVIATGLPEKPLERHMFLTRLISPGAADAASLLAKTPEEFESGVPSLYLDIAVDGQILYDLYGYMTERLATLRRVIAQAGLYREHTQAGDWWRWKQQPSGQWSIEWGN